MRNTFIYSSLIKCILISLIVSLFGSERTFSQSYVPMFRGDFRHTGVLNTKDITPQAKMKWRFQTGGMVRSTPAIFNGTLYFGSGDHNFYAVDANTSELKWKFPARGIVYSSPAVDDGIVFFTGGDDYCYAVDAATGKLKWEFQSGKDLALGGYYTNGGWDYFQSSPAVYDGKVYFGAGDGYFYALDKESGKVKWSFQTAGIVRSSPAIDGSAVYFGSHDGTLYALNNDNGKLIWKYKTIGNKSFPKGEVQSSPAVTDSFVYFGSRDGHLYAVSKEDGKLKWRADHEGSWVITSPAVYNNVVFAGSSDAEFFQAVDARTGKELWRYKTPSNVFSSPVVCGSMVYFGCWNGIVFGLDITNGEAVWGHYAEGPFQSSPLISDGKLYVGCDDGYLYCLE